MTVCVVTTSLSADWFYPVIDPHRIPGPGPWSFGYAFAWDGVTVTVTPNATLSRCQMNIALSTSLAEPKEIDAFNFFTDTFVTRVGSPSLSLPTSMRIQKRGPTQGCSTGTDTVVLVRFLSFPRGRTAMYTFPPDDFWDFWGGCDVMFTWHSDTVGSGLSGAQSPAPTYPIVRFPDGTLMMDSLIPGIGGAPTIPGFRIVFGGTDFPADPAYLRAMGFDTTAAVPFTQLPAFPADFTLVREWNRREMFVVFGGAKFQLPDPPMQFAMTNLVAPSDNTARLHTLRPGETPLAGGVLQTIPSGGSAKLLAVPFNGTLIKEQHDPKVFLVENSQLRWVTSTDVMDAKCLPWRLVRTVPDNTLAALPHGPDLL